MAEIGGKATSVIDKLDTKVKSSLSPPSGNSSDTLNDNESFGDERSGSNFSPLSGETLDFGDLNIQDDDSTHPQSPSDRGAGSLRRNGKHHDPPATAFHHQVQHFRRISHPSSSSHALGRGGGFHRNSRTWISDENRAAQEFLTVRNSMRRMFRNADVAKWKIADYVAHRKAVAASAAAKQTRQAQSSGNEANLHVPPITPHKQEMLRRCGLPGNFEQVGNFSRALGEKTIWCKDWQNGKDEIAPWPCLAEMKWEGDDRAKTGVGRYPPLPREQGPVGLSWNQLQAVEQYPLDQIARIPTMEDVYLPVDEIDDQVKYDLLNKDLEDAIDSYLES